MIPLDEILLLHFGALILSLLLVRIAKLSLGKFSFLYLVMAGVNIVIHELMYPQEFLTGIIISTFAGFLAIIALAGIVGTKVSPMNYSTLLSFIGLSPWYISLELSITLILAVLFVSAIYGYVQQYWAFKSLGYRWMPTIAQAESKMKKDDFIVFQKRSNIVFAYPFIIAIVITALLISS